MGKATIVCAKGPLEEMLVDLKVDAEEPPLTIRGCKERFTVYARQLSTILAPRDTPGD